MGETNSHDGDSADAAFFEQVLRASGLAAVIGRSAIERACDRAGVDAETLDPMSLAIALPHIEETVRLYLPDQADARMFAVRALLTPVC
jgi:hypothetical protein